MTKVELSPRNSHLPYLDQGPDEEAGDDGQEGAGHQLQEEAVEPDIEFV